jgi:hypothetical protein
MTPPSASSPSPNYRCHGPPYPSSCRTVYGGASARLGQKYGPCRLPPPR